MNIKNISLKAFIIATMSYFAMLALCIWLGFWQMERLEWKEALLSNLRQKWLQSPDILPKTLEDLKGKEFFHNSAQRYPNELTKYDLRLYSVEGYFSNDPHYYRVRHHPTIGKSFDVFTVMHLIKPFKAILPVAIGTVPLQKKDKLTLPQEKFEFTGFFRIPYKDISLVKNKGLVSNTPYLTLSKHFKKELLPFTLSLSEHNSPIKDLYYFKTDQFMKQIPNNHFSYMLTWFMFGGIVTLFYAAWLRKQLYA